MLLVIIALNPGLKRAADLLAGLRRQGASIEALTLLTLWAILCCQSMNVHYLWIGRHQAVSAALASVYIDSNVNCILLDPFLVSDEIYSIK